MQMKQRERWKRTCQRLGRGEINEGDSGGAVLENRERIKWEMMYGGHAELAEGPWRGYRNNEQRAKISDDGEHRPILQAVNPPSAHINISSTSSI